MCPHPDFSQPGLSRSAIGQILISPNSIVRIAMVQKIDFPKPRFLNLRFAKTPMSQTSIGSTLDCPYLDLPKPRLSQLEIVRTNDCLNLDLPTSQCPQTLIFPTLDLPKSRLARISIGPTLDLPRSRSSQPRFSGSPITRNSIFPNLRVPTPRLSKLEFAETSVVHLSDSPNRDVCNRQFKFAQVCASKSSIVPRLNVPAQ